MQQRRNTPQDGSSMASILYPSHGFRDDQKRRGVAPKDHMRDNRVALREAHYRNEAKKMEDEAKASMEPYKMSRFRNVESKLVRPS